MKLEDSRLGWAAHEFPGQPELPRDTLSPKIRKLNNEERKSKTNPSVPMTGAAHWFQLGHQLSWSGIYTHQCPELPWGVTLVHSVSLDERVHQRGSH